MLKRVENVKVSHHVGWLTRKGHVTLHVGAKSYQVHGSPDKTTFAQMMAQTATFPVTFGIVGERRYWLFQDRWHWDNEALTAEQVHALLVTRDQRRQATVNRAQSMVAMAQVPQQARRQTIPDDVKQYVWKRDGGSCRACGSNVELQFDHVIPISMGGSSDPSNLQVMCGPCNRRKGASVV